ncbi:hypothetical protein D3C77_594620 [compost metagenome]
MAFEPDLVDYADLRSDRADSHPSLICIDGKVHHLDYILYCHIGHLLMERQINDTPWCGPEHMMAHLRPDVGPSFLLDERVLRLFIRTFALNIELQFT